ncbi:hypothetical protein HOG21_03125 [bacterium]|nr:hypothetical protein [bacterium]
MVFETVLTRLELVIFEYFKSRLSKLLSSHQNLTYALLLTVQVLFISNFDSCIVPSTNQESFKSQVISIV